MLFNIGRERMERELSQRGTRVLKSSRQSKRETACICDENLAAGTHLLPFFPGAGQFFVFSLLPSERNGTPRAFMSAASP